MFGTVVGSAVITTYSRIYAQPASARGELFDEILRAYPHYKIVYDVGVDQALELAGRARKLGLKTAAIDRDITELWNSDLKIRWKKEPSWIAGITSSTSLFLLDQMAKDEGHCTIHQYGDDPEACLWVIGPIA